MSRGPHNFKQSDATKAIKALEKSGVKGWRVEIVAGKIVFRRDDERADPVTEDAGEWN
jgi:hypothetical protein